MLYDVLAPIYDTWQEADRARPFGLIAYDRLMPTLARAQPEVRSFLDLGCGTGDLLLALGRARPDWRLAGVDASAGMLAVAAGKPGSGRVAWLRARLDAALPFKETFDAAGAFYDTLNHLPDTGALARAFRAIANVLRPGGLFAFDLTNAVGFTRWWQGQRRWTGPEWSVEITTRYDVGARTGHAHLMVSRSGAPTGRFRLTERWFPDPEVRAALAAAGLEVERTDSWSPSDLDPPGKTWWIAVKPAPCPAPVSASPACGGGP